MEVLKHLKWLIHPSARYPALKYSRAKNIAGVAIISLAIVPPYSLFYYLLSDRSDAYAILLFSLFAFIPLIILKVNGSIVASQIALVGSIYAILTWLTYNQGGIMSPVAYWLVSVPIIASMLNGIIAGVVWGVISIITVSTLYLMQYDSYWLPKTQVNNVLFLQFLDINFLIVCLFIVVLIFEIGKRQGFKKLENSIVERTRSEKKMTYIAHYDQLTGLANRILYGIQVKLMLDQAKKSNKKVVLIYIDLDHFKYVNDTMGHTIGDLLLFKVASLLKETVVDEAFIARLGGDEFAVVLDRVERIGDAINIAKRIITVLNKPIIINNYEAFTSASIGISIYPDNCSDVTSLTKYADIAMYQAKEKGRNMYQYFDEQLSKQISLKVAIDVNLHNAIKNNELYLLYQPQYEPRTNRIIGIEVLLRWKSTQLGSMKPDFFIPIAEKNGVIKEIGEWSLVQISSQIKEWHQKGLMEKIKISINLSIFQITQENFLQRTTAILNQAKIHPNNIEFELTETAIMSDPDRTLNILYKLRSMGFQIAIDDFGTGYSSLARLKNMPIQTLKIDKSFIFNVLKSKEDASIVKAIIVLGHVLGMKVIAEGVEQKDQLEFLKELGCDYVQGYLYYPPLDKDEITKLLIAAKLKEQITEVELI